MKKIIVLLLAFFYCLVPQAQDAEGELIIEFVDKPVTYDLAVTIDAIGTRWDCDHELTTSYSGGTEYYDEQSDPVNHPSDACWHNQGFTPVLAMGFYNIKVTNNDTDDEVWFKFDWRTSELPPGAGLWDDQVFYYSIKDNEIYRESDPTKTNIHTDTLYIWTEINEIGHDTEDLEPYTPSLTSSPYYGHPNLVWSFPAWDDYRTGNEVWRSYGKWEKITTTSANDTDWVDWTYTIGEKDASYKIRAINGDSFSGWSNTINYYSSKKLGSESESSIVHSYELEQNFPNPFNPTTTIAFSLKNDSFVTLRVFDILGKNAITLVNENLSAGKHQVEFNGSSIESGIYFYEIQAGLFKDTKKLMLLK